MNNPVIIGNATLYLGDCLEVLTHLLPVGAVITDPPFNVGKSYDLHNDSMPEPDYLAWMETVIGQCRRISPQLWFVVPSSKLINFWNLMPEAHQVIVEMAAGYAVRSGWTQKFASLLVEGKPPRNPWNLWKGIRHRGEGYFFKEDTFDHPGYTPMGIMSRAVQTSLARSICDPFMGTGTTGVCAVRQGKEFFGCEISPNYFSIACRRIEEAQKQGLFAMECAE